MVHQDAQQKRVDLLLHAERHHAGHHLAEEDLAGHLAGHLAAELNISGCFPYMRPYRRHELEPSLDQHPRPADV